mgnify:CR=1 FL=1
MLKEMFGQYAATGGAYSSKLGKLWTTLLTQLDNYPSVRTLQANIKTARENLATWSKVTQETTDRSKPESTLNVLARANQELGADFDLDGFRHFARYDRELGRIEMHLESRRAQRVEILGRGFDFAAGETIHTENSYKYSVPEFQALAGVAGWRPLDVWTDAERLFSVQLYARPAETPPSTM